MIDCLSHMEDMGFPLGNLYGLVSTGWTAQPMRGPRARCFGRSVTTPSRGHIRILETVIPAIVAYREAASAQEPVHRFEPTRQRPSGLESLLSLVRELPIGLADAVLTSRMS